MRAIEEALENASELLPYAAQAEDTDIWRLTVRTAIETNAKALALLRSMDGQKPAAWIERATFSNGEVRDMIAATREGVCQIANELWRSAIFPPTRETIPLHAHPSPQTGDPRLTVEEAMDAFRNWCDKDMKTSPVDDGLEVEWKFPDLRERLTKAAK